LKSINQSLIKHPTVWKEQHQETSFHTAVADAFMVDNHVKAGEAADYLMSYKVEIVF
jgi:hypothetical protein